MPVIHVRALPQADGVDAEAVLGAACVALARLLDGDPRGTWGTWETIERYVEGDLSAQIQPRDTHPPLVRVLAFEGRPPELVAAMLRCVAEQLASGLGLQPGNVFVTYDEIPPGHLYAG